MSVASLIASAESNVEAGNLHAGLDLFLQARDESFRLGDLPSYIRCCQAAAVVYDNLGRFVEAVESLDLGITASTLDVVVTSGLLINKGVCLLKLKEWKKAQATFKRASSILRRVPPRMRTAEMHELIDMAENNVWGVDDILKLIESGLTVTVNADKDAG
jgi:tetratricopeptide (TPR) repeat protein